VCTGRGPFGWFFWWLSLFDGIDYGGIHAPVVSVQKVSYFVLLDNWLLVSSESCIVGDWNF
jgi:hypothetical protein